MANTIDIVLRELTTIDALYFRLILIVGSPGSGKTQILRQVAKQTNTEIINVGLNLSLEMLELTQRQRVLEVGRILSGLVTKSDQDLVLLDNTEFLFETQLQQDPLRLLQTISRQKKIVSTWNGRLVDNYLTYATLGHPEYRKYSATELVIISTE